MKIIVMHTACCIPDWSIIEFLFQIVNRSTLCAPMLRRFLTMTNTVTWNKLSIAFCSSSICLVDLPHFNTNNFSFRFDGILSVRLDVLMQCSRIKFIKRVTPGGQNDRNSKWVTSMLATDIGDKMCW